MKRASPEPDAKRTQGVTRAPYSRDPWTFRGNGALALFWGVLARVDESERDRHAKRPTLGAEAKQGRVVGIEHDRRYDVSGLHSAAAEADP